MTSPLLPAIHHVALICSDYARSKAFYSETLGFRIISEAYRVERDSWKLDLEVSPGVSLELFSFPLPPPRPSRPEAQGLRHLAFAVPNVDVVIATLSEREWMNSRGAVSLSLPIPMVCLSSCMRRKPLVDA
jgi:glyoxylase I family protein